MPQSKGEEFKLGHCRMPVLFGVPSDFIYTAESF